MEHRNPQSAQSNPSINHPLILVTPDRVLLCQMQQAIACQQRNGQFRAPQKRSKAARYCRDCQVIEQRAKSAAWKRQKRQEIGWSAYADMYSPYFDQDEKRAYQRDYKRAWRQRQREAERIAEPLVMCRAAQAFTTPFHHDKTKG